ncbi:MAG TPA: hypothetical protein VIW07_18035 [Candidatus Udaeobacter sp.]
MKTFAIATHRKLPRLLFVTSRDALCRKIGVAKAESVIKSLRSASPDVVEGITDGCSAKDAVTVACKQLRSDHKGVVIIGDYDVVPSFKLDVLDPAHRAQLTKEEVDRDPDRFVVWSDDPYGRPSIGKSLPVSRTPDCGSFDFLKTTLCAHLPERISRYGIRNFARPFAANIYDLMPGKRALLISGPTDSSNIGGLPSAALFYFMLHGDYSELREFWGETPGRLFLSALKVDNLPAKVRGLAFAGCCWGALIVDSRACFSHNTPRTVRVSDSIALSFLAAGGLAFIGCTGSHYSPLHPPYGHAGGPLHRAFWKRLLSNRAPAKALFDAKAEFLRKFPHGMTAAVNQAIELKTLRQFTCLGLGW